MQTFDANVMERTEDYALRVIRLYSALPDYPAPGYQVALFKSKTRNPKPKIPCLNGARRMLPFGFWIVDFGVGANFAESTRSHSTPDKIAKQQICVKELEETAYWLRLLSKADVVKPERLNDLLAETTALTALLVSSIKRLSGREEPAP